MQLLLNTNELAWEVGYINKMAGADALSPEIRQALIYAALNKIKESFLTEFSDYPPTVRSFYGLGKELLLIEASTEEDNYLKNRIQTWMMSYISYINNPDRSRNAYLN